MAKSNEITVGELATKMQVPTQDLVLAARSALNRDSLNENYKINKSQERKIDDAWRARTQPSVPATDITDIAGPYPNQESPVATFSRDSRPKFETLRFKDLGFQVWCHQDVYDGIEARKHLSQRTAMALRQIIAFGSTSVAKGCSDQQNRGWLRTPLGGGSGNHYYLWWAKQGSRALKDFPGGRNDIVIRSIRHHDDHAALVAGTSVDDYISINRSDISTASKDFESPWNAAQKLFIDGDAPIRLAIGQPGSGKTTVLWEAVDQRTDQSVLYLTWSQRLVGEAEKHFKAFAPVGTNIHAYDFATLLGHICKRDAVRKAMDAARADFESVLPRDNRASILGPWTQRTAALYAEVRAHWAGSTSQSISRNQSTKQFFQSSSRTYLDDPKTMERLGARAADAVVKIVEEIEQSRPLADVFPELEIASEAMQILNTGGLPKGFERITRVVVDEIQDLTGLELNVILELCKAIERASGRRPFLLMAGDEGQTVRPSGFKWNSTADLINERVGPPERFQLQDSVRYPSRIAEVLERAAKLYGSLTKDERPRRQTKGATDDHRLANIFHVSTHDPVDGVELLRNLTGKDGTAVIYASEDIPAWAMEQVGQGILTPVEAKGLEYQTVCVINPGYQLRMIVQASRGTDDPFESLYRRTQIDQLRVAMSRATETLVFVDIGATEEDVAESRKILGYPASWNGQDLLNHLSNPELTQEDRVSSRIREAQALIEVRPARAWQLAVQALEMLGQPDLHNGVSDRNLRQESAKNVLAIAAKLIAEGLPVQVNRNAIDSTIEDALNELGSDKLRNAFGCFLRWHDGDELGPFDLLDALAIADSSEVELLRAALASKSQKLKSELDAGAKEPATAGRYSGDVESWLRLCGTAGDLGQDAAALRMNAVDVLLDNQSGNDALRVLGQLASLESTDDQFRIGRAKELLGRFIEAAKAYELAKAYGSAVRCWRNAAEWQHAILSAQSGDVQDPVLEWLASVETSVNAKPKGPSEQLHDNEKIKLGELKKRLRWP